MVSTSTSISISIKTRLILRDEVIHYEKTKFFYDTSQKPKILIDSIIMKSESQPLVEVTPYLLKIFRKSGQPGFVLKDNGKLFYAKGPRSQKQNYIECVCNPCIHKCSDRDMICQRLSALPDTLGGCAKVRDKDAAIEDYGFITRGYEVFNVFQGVLVVLECRHWIPNYDARGALTSHSTSS